MNKTLFENKELFKNTFIEKVEETYAIPFEKATMMNKYQVLGKMVMNLVSSDWIETKKKIQEESRREAYYFSMEFLIGRLLTNNLYNLGIRSFVEDAFNDLGLDINELEHMEADAALGNGGLGRLAACFLDSLACLGYPGHGVGIRYKYGLFQQQIKDGYQYEVPENWLKNEYVFEVRKEEEATLVPYYGEVELIGGDINNARHYNQEFIKSVPYEVPIVGHDNGVITNLNLYNAEAPEEYPINWNPIEYEKHVRQISEYLYPDDSTDDGKILRLKQQYFFVSAGLKKIVNKYKENHDTLDNFYKHVVLHINDTHPVLLIPELMRVLIDEEGYDYDTAWDITTKTCAYTNHTILAEALEKWPVRLFAPLLPRIHTIVDEINRRYCSELLRIYEDNTSEVTRLAIIGDDTVRMAHLAIVASYSVNGVAALHAKLLKEVEMKEFHKIYPTKFNNKTNGITHRRWCLHTNPELVDILENTIGNDWIKEPSKLQEFRKFEKDAKIQKQVDEMKKARKQVLADRIYNEQGIKLDVNSIFDIQVKRLHEYKRQLMNALHIMYVYDRLKNDPDYKANYYPHSFIFGAKAASGYAMAKNIIKLINTIADKVNNDEDTSHLLKVVFIENYNVTYAELIMPAADLSEQISTASKEASGTGNMKFMMNGALTIGTLDGANVEIDEYVGRDNIFIFGLNADEVNEIYKNKSYNSKAEYDNDDRIRQTLDNLVNGYFEKVDQNEFKTIYDGMLYNDNYLILKDFAEYIDAHERANEAYKDRSKWLEMSIVNIAESGVFSSDRTIDEYAKEIWKLEKL